MIGNKTVLAIIPARGGSKGVPRKNIRELGGKPLLAWTIEEAKKSKYIDQLVLSSEDAEIIAVAQKWGCEVPFVRPQELAQDDTPSIDPVLHVIEKLPQKYDYVVLLQPTSPLRLVIDIDTCIELIIEKNSQSCVSITEPEKSPMWMYKMDNNSRVLENLIQQDKEIHRRQDLPPIYALNGAVYVTQCAYLCKSKKFIGQNTIGYVMPLERSLDIDTELDFSFISFILSQPTIHGGI